MDVLKDLAAMAGLALTWTDFRGRSHEVAAETLKATLAAMGIAVESDADIADSRHRLLTELSGEGLHFITTEIGTPTLLPPGLISGSIAVLHLENGERREIRLTPGIGGLAVPPILEPGYHELELGEQRLTLAVAPPRALSIHDVIGHRKAFGVAAQIYSLPSTRYASFGDFGALAPFAERMAAGGADAVAISPTHALFAADLTRSSPYSPSTRLFHNVLYADPTAVFDEDFADVAHDEAEGAELVDWPSEGTRKLAGLRRLFDRFRAHGSDAHREAFAAFRDKRGALLEEHAIYEALHGHFLRENGSGGWQGWPEEYRTPSSPAVAAFAREHADEVDFHAFLQWLAETSIVRAQERACAAGMGIGLIADLAVGMDGGGSHAWSHPDDILLGASVGAPPDPLGPSGQDWGLTTFSPMALRRHGFAPFIKTLRAAMRGSGGVRIDHIMGLARLWLVPWGMESTQGVYLSYPLDDMLRIVALESHRNRAIVIGEDLGTVPDGFRGRLDQAGVLGMRVLFFERDHEGRFRDPRGWDRHAVAMTTTHDLPTMVGWWRGNDISWRDRIGELPPSHGADAQMVERNDDRRRFWEAAIDCGAAEGSMPDVKNVDQVVDAGLAYVGLSGCELAIVPAEDLCGMVEQPNLPGTMDEHPNWRRRLPADALDDPAVTRRLERLSSARTTMIRPNP
jgi:4-alpha-glucanotransferase